MAEDRKDELKELSATDSKSAQAKKEQITATDSSLKEKSASETPKAEQAEQKEESMAERESKLIRLKLKEMERQHVKDFKSRKKLWIAVFCLMIVFAAAAGFAAVWLHLNIQSRDNEFRLGFHDVLLFEIDQNQNAKDITKSSDPLFTQNDVLPGQTLNKTLKLQNEGVTDVNCIIKITFKANSSEVDLSQVLVFKIDDSIFTKNSEGKLQFTFDEKIKSKTDKIFVFSIEIPSTVGNLYQNSDCVFDIYFEIVQA